MLTTQDRILIEQRIANAKPSTAVAYLLALFLGCFGAHRFYLGRTGSAIAQLILTITIIGLLVTGIWVLVDLFLIPGMIRQKIEVLRQQYTVEAMSIAPDPAPAPTA